MHRLDVEYPWQHWIGFFFWATGFFAINKQSQIKIPFRDPFLIPLIGFLTGWGMLAIYRLDISFGQRQAFWLSLGMIIVLVMMRSPSLLTVLRKYQYIWLIGGLALTMLTLFMGAYPGGEGPRLWLNIGGIFFQPSELLKLLLIIFLAAYFADNQPITPNLLQLVIPTFILFSLALVTLIIQRDLGTSTLFIIIYTAIVYMVTGKKRFILISTLVILLAGILGYQLFDVIRLRVDAWINPWLDPSGRSFQIVQSLIAVAAGGIFGRGPALGSPGLVPIAHSDFIFSTIAEESGLVGTIGFLLLLAILLFCGMRIAINAVNHFQRYLAAGLTTYFLAQAILIIGGNLRLLPLTGVTLPFVSYGGSSLITNFLALAILLIISGDPMDTPVPIMHPRPYLFISATALSGLAVIASSLGWWVLARGGDLQLRNDNLRRAINDRYVPRGVILDQKSQPIVSNEGESGSFVRKYYYPPLSATTGYNSQVFGQSGIEKSMDGYLRGEKGNPASQVWWHHLLYGQSPEGLDVRLSIDLNLQQKTDEMFKGKNGAAVLINAETGELLVLASHPNIDPNQVDDMWSGWMSDPSAPLINRATQVNYAIGTTIVPFILNGISEEPISNETPAWTGLYYADQAWFCATNPDNTHSWEALLKAGCPQAVYQILHQWKAENFVDFLEEFGFSSAPQLYLPVAQPDVLSSDIEPIHEVFGNNSIMVTPLQMAMAAAALSNGGTLVQPRLAVAVGSSNGWVMLPNEESHRIEFADLARVIDQLSIEDPQIWEVNGVSYSDQGRLSWFIGGTNTDWMGTPYAFVVLLEGNYSNEAKVVGETILRTVIQP